MVKLKEYSWYNFDKICSFNAVQNYIVGSRGEGKTYGAVKRAITKFIRSGEQFGYLRRTDRELQTAKGSFFNAIEFKNEFPSHDFQVTTIDGAEVGQIAPRSTRDDDKRPWKTLMYFFALSRAQSYKSSNYPLVTTLIYDEFIKEKGYTRYLQEEYAAFMGFFTTIDRNQDKTTVFFLANAVTIMNPYFIALNIQPDLQREYGRYKKDSKGYYVAVHISDNKDFKAEVGETRYAQFIEGSSFGDYALGNTFADSHQDLIRKKTSDAKYRYTLETKTGSFAVWQDFELGLFFIEGKQPRPPLTILTLVSENMSDTKRLVTPTHKLIGSLRTAYSHGRAYFDKASTRNTFAQVFNR